MNEIPHDNPDSDSTEPEPVKVLDEYQFATLITQPINLYIIQKLREGPMDVKSLHKLLKAKFHKEKRNLHEFYENLEKLNVIKRYNYKKETPNPDRFPNQYPNMNVGESRDFYILIKDFYAIRKPPMHILEQLDEMAIPRGVVNDFRKEIKQFFDQYTNKSLSGDDEEVIQIFLDQKMLAAITYLTEKIYKLKDLSGDLASKWQGEPVKIFQKLEQKNFIKTIEVTEKGGSNPEKWILLKTDIELKPIFPEYLIRNINQLMAEQKLDKDFALITLNNLKFFYLQMEKPEILESYMKKISDLEEKLKPSLEDLEKGKKVDSKKISKLFAQIIELVKKIGDLDLYATWNSKWEKILEKINKK